MAADLNALTGTYYLDHLESLLAAVKGRYGDLFDSDEQALLADFAALPVDARALYARFLSRRGSCFRQDKLHYRELDVEQAIHHLAKSGFIAPAPADNSVILPLLTKAEIGHFYGLDAKQKRPVLLQQAQLMAVPALPFWVWQTLNEGLFRRCLLLYFGNAYQDLSEFITTTLEHVRYESYPLDSASRFYQDRPHLERHFQLAELAKTLDATDDEALVALADSWPQGDDNRWQRLTLQLARRLERAGCWQQALAFYEKLSLPPARERRVRVLEKQQGVEAAWQALVPIIQAPKDASEQDFIDIFGQRLAKKCGQLLPQQAVSTLPEWQKPLLAGEQSVEQKALCYFADGMHSENQLMTGLFGLLFWDIIFAPIPGAFFHPFQRGPRDLFSQQFYPRRQALIDQRLTDIASGWQQRAHITFANKYGIANALVQWPFWTEQRLALCRHISGAHLVAWFRHYLADPRHHRSGFPDLLVVEERGYRLVEVKGPGDRLQPGQKRWLRTLASQGLPVAVLHLN
ncbi:VRR-NUC domain-containing protein [Gallaecimonas mangrovi]|uniref:VRR-NUC domain-containing protein n=1 Tax=Gallaecimonas mangrovi TaxID=2291597 RepID=UPI000E1FFF12|nr:VRR-NUC domain-containing protein [Gallaecimonas mangrovi]